MPATQTVEVDRDRLTIERAGTRTVDRQYSDDTRDTAVFRITATDDHGRDHVSESNAVRIGCPECKANATAIIRPDGKYECACGYTNDLTRSTLQYQGRETGDVWVPY